jgi:uncharacterized protein YkwD
MLVAGAGRRTEAALVAVIALAISTASTAAERGKANNSQAVAVSAKPGAKSHPRPQVASVASRSSQSLFAKAGIAPDPGFQSLAAPNEDEKFLVDLVNAEREARRLQPVTWDGLLSRLARNHGQDMRAAGRISHHSTSDGADYTTRLARTTYRARAAAENVAYNKDVLAAHRALMDSSGHRRNILDPDLRSIGTAVVTEPGDQWVYVVEDFAAPIASVTDAEAEQQLRSRLAHAGNGWFHALPEDQVLSGQLDGLLEQMIDSGSVADAVGGGVGDGWTMAFTSLDPAAPPPSALTRARKAESYSLAVSFRKTARYPFGAYWVILFLKGVY